MQTSIARVFVRLFILLPALTFSICQAAEKDWKIDSKPIKTIQDLLNVFPPDKIQVLNSNNDLNFSNIREIFYLRSEVQGKNKQDKDNSDREKYLPTLKEFDSGTCLRECIEEILFNDKIEEFSSNQYDFISSAYIVEKFKKVLNHTKKFFNSDPEEYKKFLDARYHLVTEAIGVRLVCTNKTTHREFPYSTMTQPELEDEFKKLQQHILKTDANLTSTDYTEINRLGARNNHSIGMAISAAETDVYRLQVKKRESGKLVANNPTEMWTNPKLCHRISSSIRKLHKSDKLREYTDPSYLMELNASKKSKNPKKLKNPKNLKGLTTKRFVHDIASKFGALQFNPAAIGEVISYLKILPQGADVTIRNIIDPCAGWGERLVGAMAASCLGVKRYIATDINPNLPEAYQALINKYKPADFEAKVYDIDCLKLSLEQMCPSGEKNQLFFSCPPYFNVEEYQGSDQSYKNFPSYQMWRDGFLFGLVNKAMESLEHNGFMVIIIADVTKNQYEEKYPVVEDLYKYIQQQKPKLSLIHNEPLNYVGINSKVVIAQYKTPRLKVIFPKLNPQYDAPSFDVQANYYEPALLLNELSLKGADNQQSRRIKRSNNNISSLDEINSDQQGSWDYDKDLQAENDVKNLNPVMIDENTVFNQRKSEYIKLYRADN